MEIALTLNSLAQRRRLNHQPSTIFAASGGLLAMAIGAAVK
jgi:hypothetical protein